MRRDKVLDSRTAALVGLLLCSAVAAQSQPAAGNQTGPALASNSGTVCNHEYALCTSAPCIPEPNDSGSAVCDCEVRIGASIGHSSCDQRAPKIVAGAKALVSTFSFDQALTRPMMICPSGDPWTDCLDMPCTADAADPLKAICLCKIVRDGGFLTLGGECNHRTCKTSYWSGGPLNDVSPIVKLAEQMHIDMPANFCPPDENQLKQIFGIQ